ncbi:MAG: hypothetical protein ACP5O0_00565 [Acidimicrobiales bacterium]
MELEEFTSLLRDISGALDEVEYRLSQLYLFANADLSNSLVRSAREVAQASSVVMQLEAERIKRVANLSAIYGFAADARLRDVGLALPSPWREGILASAEEMKASLDRISDLQRVVRTICSNRIGLFDTALSLIGRQDSTYGADGSVSTSSARVLSESV